MTKNQALVCIMRFDDPKQASCTISSDSDHFRALNAPSFSYQRLHLFKSNLYIERIFTKRSKKKIWTLFYFQNISFCCKWIPKLAPNSLQTTLCDYVALNAPKSKLTFLTQSKAQHYNFQRKIQRIFDFQIFEIGVFWRV